MSNSLAVLPESEVAVRFIVENLARRRVYQDLAPAEAFQRLSQKRVERLLSSEQASLLLQWSGQSLCGAACWSKLLWDSELFGFPSARLEFLVAEGDYWDSRHVKRRLIGDVYKQCQREGVRHLTARVDTGDFSAIHALEASGFELIDGIQTFAISLDGLDLEAPPAATPSGVCVRLFRESDLDQVLKIARTAYIYDRFHADYALSSAAADHINEAWLRNSCLGSAADAVIIASQGESVLGYVTCKIDQEAASTIGVSFGTIVMVATAENARGQGVASLATLGALRWFREKGVRIVEVGTQLRNLAAGRLYEKCGFRLCGASLTFRKLV
ncbi:MAG TPA: GNAT family N-acetyltransferase [Bryobacterales bacterium]|jgi:ribosomal protein S18 acetylase RimI-like enzyme|nr:GNAT family N-acetyltransferase [Bryobacterales bacterium]